jgi:hypothetical protein
MARAYTVLSSTRAPTPSARSVPAKRGNLRAKASNPRTRVGREAEQDGRGRNAGITFGVDVGGDERPVGPPFDHETVVGRLGRNPESAQHGDELRDHRHHELGPEEPGDVGDLGWPACPRRESGKNVELAAGAHEVLARHRDASERREGRTRLPFELADHGPVHFDLGRSAHQREPMKRARARQVETRAPRGDAAPRHDRSRAEQEGRRRDIARHVLGERLQPPVPTFDVEAHDGAGHGHRHVERAEHPLRVIGRKNPLAHVRRFVRPKAGEKQGFFHVGRRRREFVLDAGQATVRAHGADGERRRRFARLGERKRTLHDGAAPSQSVEDLRHTRPEQLVIAAKDRFESARSENRGEKAHRSRRTPAIDGLARCLEPREPDAPHDGRPFRVDVDGDAQRAQSLDHGCRIGPRGMPSHLARPLGMRGQDERECADGVVGRDGNAADERLGLRENDEIVGDGHDGWLTACRAAAPGSARRPQPRTWRRCPGSAPASP